MNASRYLKCTVVLGMVMLMIGCVGARTQKGQPTPQSDIVGAGIYHYRLVLMDADTGNPAVQRPFALSNSSVDLPFVLEEKDVYQGVTDEAGQTPVIALDVKVEASDWFLRERFGSGPYGEQFHMINDDYPEAVVGRPYTVVLCTEQPRYFSGYTDEHGYTAYTATQEPNVRMSLYYGHVESSRSHCE